MQLSRLEDLLSKFSSNALSPEERDELASLLQQEEVKNDMIGILQNRMLQEDASLPFDEERFMPVLKNLLEADRVPNQANIHRIKRRTLWIRYAAAAVLLAAAITTISIIFFNKRKTEQVAHTEVTPAPGGNHATLTLADGRQILLDSAKGDILQQEKFRVSNENGQLGYEGNTTDIGNHTLSTPRGGQYQLRLPDGTQVWLNTASSISYPTNFRETRTVTITGEAYFEVAKNKSMPFIVNVNKKASVEVLGTHFNVKSYTDEAAIKTTLLEGKVKVSVQEKNGQSVVLQPGEQASIRNTVLSVVNDIDPDAAIAWKNGLFDFGESDLPTVMRELSRWYDIQVRYEGPLPTDLYEGKIPMNASLNDVLKMLEKNDIRFRLEGSTLTVLTGKK